MWDTRVVEKLEEAVGCFLSLASFGRLFQVLFGLSLEFMGQIGEKRDVCFVRNWWV